MYKTPQIYVLLQYPCQKFRDIFHFRTKMWDRPSPFEIIFEGTNKPVEDQEKQIVTCTISIMKIF